jgi:starvation-inducible DNA-binding protein
MSFEITRTGNPPSAAPASPASDVPALRPTPLQPLVLADRRIALPRKTRADSATVLNRILADTLSLRDLYAKHHWQASGPAFFQLRLLFDKQRQAQEALADAIAERVEILGGAPIAMAADVARMTMITRPPRSREDPAAQLARLAEAHERVLHESREAARRALEQGDDGTNDLLVSAVIRANERHAWFVHELLQTPGASPAIRPAP